MNLAITSLPLQLGLISSESLSLLRGRCLILYRGAEEQQPIKGWKSREGMPRQISAINPNINEEREIIAIDSSVIVLGEAEDGFILSGKVAVASRRQGKSKASLFGPAIFYVGESNIERLDFFERLPKKLMLHDAAIAARAFRVLLERLVSFEIAQKVKESVILIDGSLKESSFEVKGANLKEIIAASLDKGNYIAGVTKNTKLKQLQRMELQLYETAQPSYIDVSEIVRLFISRLASSSYLMKLSSDGIPLRVDIPAQLNAGDVASSIVSSDLISNGYPETLKSAHLLSVFSGAEEASVKGKLARNEGSVILPSFNVRRAILGRLEGYKQ